MRRRTASLVYPRQLNIRCPEKLLKAVKASADARMTTVNSWVRQACLLALRKESTERREHEMRPG